MHDSPSVTTYSVGTFKTFAHQQIGRLETATATATATAYIHTYLDLELREVAKEKEDDNYILHTSSIYLA